MPLAIPKILVIADPSEQRELVSMLRGAGAPYDGLYYVKTATHDIQRGAYKQTFSLARNALFS